MCILGKEIFYKFLKEVKFKKFLDSYLRYRIERLGILRSSDVGNLFNIRIEHTRKTNWTKNKIFFNDL